MDTLNDVMTDLLIEQDDRIMEPVGKISFPYIALKAEKVILDGRAEGHANKN